MELEFVTHFYLHCQYYINERLVLMNEIHNLNIQTNNLDELSLTNLFLYGNKDVTNEINTKIINLSIDFIKNSKRFEGPLF